MNAEEKVEPSVDKYENRETHSFPSRSSPALALLLALCRSAAAELKELSGRTTDGSSNSGSRRSAKASKLHRR